jgi:hypothetical protein
MHWNELRSSSSINVRVADPMSGEIGLVGRNPESASWSLPPQSSPKFNYLKRLAMYMYVGLRILLLGVLSVTFTTSEDPLRDSDLPRSIYRPF